MTILWYYLQIVSKQNKNNTHRQLSFYSPRDSAATNMKLLLKLSILYYISYQGEASFKQCTTGYQSPSLYLRLCCVNSNLGHTFTMEEDRIRQYIFCPLVLPNSCPSQGTCMWYYHTTQFSSCLQLKFLLLPALISYNM